MPDRAGWCRAPVTGLVKMRDKCFVPAELPAFQWKSLVQFAIIAAVMFRRSQCLRGRLNGLRLG